MHIHFRSLAPTFDWTSGAGFSIDYTAYNRPTISVTTPNSAQQRCTNVHLPYSVVGLVSRVNIRLLSTSGVVLSDIASAIPRQSSYTWAVPCDLAVGTYVVQVAWADSDTAEWWTPYCTANGPCAVFGNTTAFKINECFLCEQVPQNQGEANGTQFLYIIFC